MNNFPIDMVRRTAINLANYKGKFDMTNLLNCTLGLIILPYEKRFANVNITPWNIQKPNFSNSLSYQRLYFQPIRRIEKKGRKKGEIICFDETLVNLLRKIRNGLAHQSIEPVNSNGHFVGIIITNYYPTQETDKTKIKDLAVKFPTDHIQIDGDRKIEIKDLEIEFTQEQLIEFALFVASEHLKDCLEINKEYIIDPSLPRNKNKGRRCLLIDFQQSLSSKRTVAKIKYLDTNRIGRVGIELWKLKGI